MKRLLVLAILIPLVTAGCGQPLVVAEAALSDEAGERIALSDLPIRLLPYDRDAIFDELEAAHPVPEPAIPPEILAAQARVQEAQNEWRTAEERWQTVRDELRQLAEETTRMQQQGLRGTPQYATAFERFGQLEAQVGQLENQMRQAFERFAQLQEETLVAADSIRVVREMWAEEAYADFGQVVAQRLRESGRDEIADTTNAQGISRIRAPRGRWWVYARYTLPYEELYWNVPIEVSGDSTYIGLNRENAEVRPVL